MIRFHIYKTEIHLLMREIRNKSFFLFEYRHFDCECVSCIQLKWNLLGTFGTKILLTCIIFYIIKQLASEKNFKT